MFVALPRLRSAPSRSVWALVAGVVLFVSSAHAQPNGDAPKNGAANGKRANGDAELVLPPGPPLTLGQCIAMAMEKSPILAAHRASVASSEAGKAGIDKASRILHSLIAPDLEYRQQQAASGLMATSAELMQAEYDVTYNVIRTYYTAVYAREQTRVAGDLVNQLTAYRDFVADAVKEGGVRGITVNTLDQLQMVRGQAAGRRVEAAVGYERALRALAHEMSAGPDFQFNVADATLPDIHADSITREAVVGHALSRRGEITLAAVGAEVLRLEVDAQGAIRMRLRSFTAAAGADVHSRNVPHGNREGEYRPDALAPEYPVLIVGDRKSRVAKAQALSERADAVYQKARDLIQLEAENGYLRWVEASRKVTELRPAAKSSREIVARNRKDSNGKMTDEKLIQYEALSAQTLAAYNEALYQQIVTLAALERITAGGVKVNFPGR